MTMIKQTTECVNFEASESLIQEARETFADIDKYNNNITEADIYLKKLDEKSDDKVEVGIKIFVPANNVYMSATAANFKTALQELYDRMKTKLTALKERQSEHRRERVFKP